MQNQSRDNIHVILYSLYVLTLPLGRFLNIWPTELMERMFLQFSSLAMLVGVIFLVLDGRFKTNNRVSFWGSIFIFTSIWSMLCSIVIAIIIPTTVTSPLVTCLPDIYYFFLVILSIYYNYYCLTYLVKFERLFRIFDIQIVLLLVVGFAQMATMGGVVGPYNILCSIFHLKDVDWLIAVSRGVTLWGNEPSSVSIISFVVLPYVYTSISLAKGWHKIKYIISAALFFILMSGSGSTQTLLLYIIVTSLYILFFSKKRIPPVLYKLSFIAGFLAVSTYLFSFREIEVQGDRNSMEYAIFAKVFDRENESTVVRVSTIVNDLKIMSRYPLTGVGNGNQGFFYAENLPQWAKRSESVRDYLIAGVIVNGGGNMFPSFFSGFGLFGAIFLLSFLKKYKINYQSSFLQTNPRANFMYQIGMTVFLFSGWTVVDLRESIIFLLSLACVQYNKEHPQIA